MSETVHLTAVFTARSEHLFDECDQVMQALLDLELADPAVRDAAVSADAGAGIVTVEVVADGRDRAGATQAAIARVHQAISGVVRLVADELSEQREVELVGA